MARPDPFLNLLKNIGFLPLRLPRADVAPLKMVEQRGKDLQLMGELSSAMVGGPSLPPVAKDIQTANAVQGEKSSLVKVSIGVTILGNILRALSGQDLGIAAAFARASTLRFEFADVTVDTIDIILLDQYLSQSEINPASRHIRKALVDGRMGVVTAAARARKYLVSAQKEDGSEVSIDVPLIQGVAGGKLKIESVGSSNSEFSFEGATPVTFGVQAAHIFFSRDGKFTAFNPIQAGEGALRGAEVKPKLMTAPAAFVNVTTAADGEAIGQSI